MEVEDVSRRHEPGYGVRQVHAQRERFLVDLMLKELAPVAVHDNQGKKSEKKHGSHERACDLPGNP
jgi:hypothetical protein